MNVFSDYVDTWAIRMRAPWSFYWTALGSISSLRSTQGSKSNTRSLKRSRGVLGIILNVDFLFVFSFFEPFKAIFVDNFWNNFRSFEFCTRYCESVFVDFWLALLHSFSKTFFLSWIFSIFLTVSFIVSEWILCRRSCGLPRANRWTTSSWARTTSAPSVRPSSAEWPRRIRPRDSSPTLEGLRLVCVHWMKFVLFYSM